MDLTKHPRLSDQVDALLDLRDQAPQKGYTTRLLMLCSLPRTKPLEQQYTRDAGPWQLAMIAEKKVGLPYGSLPRLLLAWLCTEAIKTKDRTIQLGPSLNSFMDQLGVAHGGASRRRLKEQMRRLFSTTVQLTEWERGKETITAGVIASRAELWWDPKQPDAAALWDSQIRLGEEFFDALLRHPVPLDMLVLRRMARSSLGLDLYMWLTWKTFRQPEPLKLNWRQIYAQFGAHPERSDEPEVVKQFAREVRRELKKIRLSWPELNVEPYRGGLRIAASESIIIPMD